MGFVLAVVLLQPACVPDAAALEQQAIARARVLDVDGAVALLDRAAATGVGCGRAVLAATYLRGLRAARDAYREGGSEPSLAPARNARLSLAAAARQGSLVADVGQYVLFAAAAAAQSERDDLATFLDHALQLERRLLEAGDGPLLPVTAHEAAGDLWLQVHRFDSARDAYARAAALLGPTPRTTVGLARAAAGLKDVEGACDAYRSAIGLLEKAGADRPERREADRYVADTCRAPDPTSGVQAPARR
jgi:hypothetical protein